MREIETIPTIRRAFSCVIEHPQVVIPFFIFFLITSFIFVYAFNRFFEFFNVFLSSREPLPGDVFQTVFGFLALIFLVILVSVFVFPFFEGWTFATAGLACKNEPVSLTKAFRKALSKYLGVLVISIIVAFAAAAIGSVVWPILFLLVFPMDFPSAVPYTSFPLSSVFYRLFSAYGLVFLIVTIFIVLFVYLKPAYILGDKSLVDSLNDGFATARKNFIPSCLVYLFFSVLQILLYVGGAILVFDTIDFEKFWLIEDFSSGYDVIQTELESLFPVALVGLFVYFLLHSILYTALAHAYMDSHEIVH